MAAPEPIASPVCLAPISNQPHKAAGSNWLMPTLKDEAWKYTSLAAIPAEQWLHTSGA